MNRTIEKIDKVLTKINEGTLIAAISLMFILVFSNVIGRYFFARTHFWVDELSRHLMISLAFLGMGLAMRQGSHSSFNILQNVLSDKWRKVVRIAVLVIVIGFIVVFFWQGLLFSLRSMNHRTEALRWRSGLWYLMIPSGAFLFIWHTMMIAKQYINKKRESDIEEVDKGKT